MGNYSLSYTGTNNPYKLVQEGGRRRKSSKSSKSRKARKTRNYRKSKRTRKLK